MTVTLTFFFDQNLAVLLIKRNQVLVTAHPPLKVHHKIQRTETGNTQPQKPLNRSARWHMKDNGQAISQRFSFGAKHIFLKNSFNTTLYDQYLVYFIIQNYQVTRD